MGTVRPQTQAALAAELANLSGFARIRDRRFETHIYLAMKSRCDEMVENRLEQASAEYYGGFRIGDVSVEVVSYHRPDITLVPALAPFRIETVSPDISIQVEWVGDLFPTFGRQLFDSGSTWRLCEGETGFQFDFCVPAPGRYPCKRLHVDRCFRRAILQMNCESFVGFPHAVIPLDYPLDELLIMHRLTQEKAIELHGCGIVRADGTGNLFVGHSGAGKSTTTRLWTAREDVEVLSDDRIIVRRDHKKQVPHRRYAPVRNDMGNFARDDNEKSPGDPGRILMYGTPWHGEAMYASPNSALLARIFVLEHGHGNVITRLSRSQAVAELFARAFVPFHRHEYVESALTFLEEVVEEIPVYRYAFEPNEAAVEVVAGFRD